MSRRQPARAAEDREEVIVLDYLERHPDLLRRHPELLAKLELPHGKNGAVSLVERQVAVLREQLDYERRRLLYLIERAREYEKLTSQLHRLTIRLIPARDLEQMRVALHASLRQEFNAEAVALKLFPLDARTRRRDPLAQTFLRFVEENRCVCGPLSGDQFAVLFGTEEGAELRSAALIPLDGLTLSGVLALGSRDPQRFTADMGTDLLVRLGAIVSAKLSELHPPPISGCVPKQS